MITIGLQYIIFSYVTRAKELDILDRSSAFSGASLRPLRETNEGEDLASRAIVRIKEFCDKYEYGQKIDESQYKTPQDSDWIEFLNRLVDIADQKDSTYIINCMAIALSEEYKQKYKLQFSQDRGIIGLIGENYLKLPEVQDPVTGELVTPQQNITETLRVLSQNPEAFYLASFLTLEDDKAMPIRKKEWRTISDMFGGKGPSFADNADAHHGIICGDNYFPKFGVSGVAECIIEEIHPWHFGMPFSWIKEGATFAVLGKHTLRFPCELKNLLAAEARIGAIKYWKTQELINNWRDCAMANDEKNAPIFAYFSAELLFLILAYRNIRNTSLPGDAHYLQKEMQIQQLIDQVLAEGLNPKQRSDNDLMIPRLLDWAGFITLEELSAYVDERMSKFGFRYLEQFRYGPENEYKLI